MKLAKNDRTFVSWTVELLKTHQLLCQLKHWLQDKWCCISDSLTIQQLLLTGLMLITADGHYLHMLLREGDSIQRQCCLEHLGPGLDTAQWFVLCDCWKPGNLLLPACYREAAFCLRQIRSIWVPVVTAPVQTPWLLPFAVLKPWV